MVSGDMEDRIADVFSEIIETIENRTVEYSSENGQKIVPLNSAVEDKAKQYQGKKITNFGMDCHADGKGEIIDMSIGIKDITLQLFDVMLYYNDNPIMPGFTSDLVDGGVYLKLVKEDEKELLLFHEDHGEFSIKYSDMAITHALQ